MTGTKSSGFIIIKRQLEVIKSPDVSDESRGDNKQMVCLIWFTKQDKANKILAYRG